MVKQKAYLNGRGVDVEVSCLMNQSASENIEADEERMCLTSLSVIEKA